MKIELEIRKVCGVIRYYPLCAVSKELCKMKKSPTLVQGDVDNLENVGFTFVFYEDK